MTFSDTALDAEQPRVAAERATLRDILRSATVGDHARLDHQLAEIDLARCDDLARFLGIHFAARAGVERWLAANCPPGWEPPVQTPLIAEDLAALGSRVEDFPAQQFEPGHSADWMGPAYVIAGSHLGNRLLLAQAGAALPCSARGFLTGTAMQDYWRRLRTLLSEAPGPDGGADAVAGARATFTHFARCVAHFGRARLTAA